MMLIQCFVKFPLLAASDLLEGLGLKSFCEYIRYGRCKYSLYEL